VIHVHFWPMRAARPIRSNPDLGRCKTLVVATGPWRGVPRGSRVGQGRRRSHGAPNFPTFECIAETVERKTSNEPVVG
jgi:hypothetical protein